ncbi:hypothetical protein HK096_003261, partial [Nowakowskiella sp. JEL0078]
KEEEFFISPGPMIRKYAAEFCDSKDAHLLDLTNENLKSASETVYNCVGANKAAWIASYYGNNYNGEPIVLVTGISAGAGSVNVYNPIYEQYTICYKPKIFVRNLAPDPITNSRQAFFLTNETQFEKASSLCKSLGGELANLNLQNWNSATTIAFNFFGSNASVWIASWNGDIYQNTPIALTTGTEELSGAVNEFEPSFTAPALCMGVSFTPPKLCKTKSIFFYGSLQTYVVCRADFSSAWISSVDGGKFEYKKICSDLGYRGMITQYGLRGWDWKYGIN